MRSNVLIVQRFYYNFREGFFEYLSDINFDFKLINATASRGRVKVHEDAKNKSFLVKIIHFFIGDNYVVFPFLFLNLIRINPKIIITEGGQNTINNFQVFLYCKIFKRNYIVWDLGKAYADFGNSPTRRIYMKLYKVLLRHSYYIFGYNSQSKNYFESLGITSEKIIILNNTIDTRKIKKIKNSVSDSTNLLSKELAIQSKDEYIFITFVGTLLRSKNIEFMPELLRMLGKKYYLIIIGDGDPKYKTELENIFQGTNHIFVGYKKLEEMKPYYDLSTFSILPGLGGLSINQSMAFGVPVLCSAADGAEKDLVIENETGYIYKDLDDAYDYIISKSDKDWQEMSIKAESFLYSKHSLEAMMNRFVEYAKLCIKNQES